MKSEIELFGIGASPLDQLWLVSQFPDSEGVQSAESMLMQGGGPVATALCAASRLGVSCSFLDVIGDDLAGDRIRQDLEHHGVNLDGCPILKGKTSHQAVVLVRKADGARHIIHQPGSVGDLKLEHLSTALKGKVLHLNGRHLATSLHAAQIASSRDMCVSFDGGANRWRKELTPILERTDWMLVAWDFALKATHLLAGAEEDEETIAWKLIEQLHAHYPNARLIAITKGSQGAWWGDFSKKDSTHFWHVPAECAVVVDTTGAGDVFHGAALAALIRGKSPRVASHFAAWAAARTCEFLGGRTALDLLTPETLDQYQIPDRV